MYEDDSYNGGLFEDYDDSSMGNGGYYNDDEQLAGVYSDSIYQNPVIFNTGDYAQTVVTPYNALDQEDADMGAAMVTAQNSAPVKAKTPVESSSANSGFWDNVGKIFTGGAATAARYGMTYPNGTAPWNPTRNTVPTKTKTASPTDSGNADYYNDVFNLQAWGKYILIGTLIVFGLLMVTGVKK